ncbi:DUF3987 domain-containing protein [Microvirga sp. 3-52]|nr:DUF3987 domain-containing protein [Microvirga sp. 3-52]
MMGASLIVLRKRSKIPVEPDWTNASRLTWVQFKKKYRAELNIGVRLGEPSKIDGLFLHVIDIDIRIPRQARRALKKLKKLLPGVNIWSLPCVRSGSGGESRHFYFLTNVPYRSKKLAHSGEKFTDAEGKQHWTWEIELFGTGKQVALPPSIHPIGNPYRWEVEFDETAPLPYISDKLIEELVSPVQDDDGEPDIEPLNLSRQEIEEALPWLNADHWCEDYEGWRNLGMALHHEFQGSMEGFDIWCGYAKKSTKYNLSVQKQHWKSYKSDARRPITMRSVMKEAAESRRRAELTDAFHDAVELDEPKPLTRAERRKLIDHFEPLVPPPDKELASKIAEPRPDDPDMSVLQQVRNEAPPFPLHILTRFWQREIEALAFNGAAPIDYAAATLFATSASLIGNSRWVSPFPGWVEATVMWCQIIGPPSANKSPAQRPYMKFLNDLEASWDPEYQEAKRLWQSRKKQSDTKRKQWEIRMAAALEKGEDVGDMPSDCIAPPEPTRRRALVGDSTLEALVRLTAANPRGFLNYRDEMTGWVQNLSRYGGMGATDRTAWLEAFGGGVYTVDRVKDGGEPVRVRNFNVSILGGIQPEPLLAMASSAEDGLQARFMPFWPENTIRKINRGERTESRARLPFEALAGLRMNKDKTTGRLEPVIVPFSSHAMDVFEEWSNNRKVAEQYAPSKLSGAFGKADAHVTRMALVLEMLGWAEDPFNDQPLARLWPIRLLGRVRRPGIAEVPARVLVFCSDVGT